VASVVASHLRCGCAGDGADNGTGDGRAFVATPVARLTASRCAAFDESIDPKAALVACIMASASSPPFSNSLMAASRATPMAMKMAAARAAAVRWDPDTIVQLTSETPIIFITIPLSLTMSTSTLLAASAATVAVAGRAMSRARGSITVITTTATTYNGSTLVRRLAHYWFGANPCLG
jgi:hypothetical protein